MPELRFVRFSEEWKIEPFKKVVKINQGLQIAISERYSEKKEGTHFYITNEFLKQGSKKVYFIKNPPASVLCVEGDILMTRTGNTGMVVTNVKGAFHNNFFKIAYPKEVNKDFLFYFLILEKIQNLIKRLAGTSTIPDLNHSDFYKIPFRFPTLDEQQKIATFLTAVDEKIQALKKKKELLELYKKGMMQKIFSQEVRFEDEDGGDFGDWEEKRGKDVFFSHSNKNHNGDLPVLSASQEFGMVLRDENGIRIQSSEKSVKSYKIVEKGDFVISLRSFQGGIEYSNLTGICSPAYIILKPKKSIYDLFFKFYFKKDSFIERLSKTVVGIRDGKQISYDAFGGLKLKIPSVKEQTKIAKFLTSLDDKIGGIEVRIEQMEQWKKGLLQKMFV